MNNCLKPETIRLSVVDDNPVIFWGIHIALRRIKTHNIEFVNQYPNGAELIANLANLNSDVVLVDISLPDIKGYDLAREILKVYPDMKIGIFSSMVDKDSILNSFKSGVLGYLPKSASLGEIVDFVLTIYSGERYLKGIVADIVFENAHFFEKQKQLNITKRESEILQLVLDGFKNREIANKLNIAERTVEFHKQNIYLKMEVTNSVDLCKAIMRLNLHSV